MTEISDLANDIVNELSKYSKEIDDKMADKIDEISKEVRDSLLNDKNIPTSTGKYKKSFYVKKVERRMGVKTNVIASKSYRLTHLLENGHLTRDGKNRTKAFPHWAKAQELADKLTDKMLEEMFDGD